MTGHVVDGKILLPATSYLGLVWKTIGLMKGITFTAIPIVFRDVKFIRATYLSKKDAVELYIAIQTGIYGINCFNLRIFSEIFIAVFAGSLYLKLLFKHLL